MNIEEYKGVYVFAQQVDGVVGGIAFELVGEAKKLAKDLNEDRQMSLAHTAQTESS